MNLREHAAIMAHVSNNNRGIARAFGSGSSMTPPPVPTGMPAPPAGMPPGAPSPGHSFKAHIAHFVRHKTGASPTLQHVHSAIDSLVQQGRFTPLQGAALKQHNGPLVGPQGDSAVQAIAQKMIGGPNG